MLDTKDTVLMDIQLKQSQVDNSYMQLSSIDSQLSEMYTDRDSLRQEKANMTITIESQIDSLYKSKRYYKITDGSTIEGIYSNVIDKAYLSGITEALSSFYNYASQVLDCADGAIKGVEEKIAELEQVRSTLSSQISILNMDIDSLRLSLNS